MNARFYAVRNDAMPRDLREGDAGSAGAGKIYDVKPEAIEAFKRILAEKDKGATVSTKEETLDALAIPDYPTEVFEAAAVEAAKPDKRARRYGNVITPTVVAIWQEWKENGRSVDWIGQNNGLIDVPETVVHTYMIKHKMAAAALRGKGGGETAVPAVSREVRQETVEEAPVVAEVEPPALDEVAATDAQQPVQAVEPYVPTKPDNLPAYLDRDYRPVPRVGDTLGNLIRLLNDERVTIEGEVDLKLNIKFGGK